MSYKLFCDICQKEEGFCKGSIVELKTEIKTPGTIYFGTKDTIHICGGCLDKLKEMVRV